MQPNPCRQVPIRLPMRGILVQSNPNGLESADRLPSKNVKIESCLVVNPCSRLVAARQMDGCSGVSQSSTCRTAPKPNAVSSRWSQCVGVSFWFDSSICLILPTSQGIACCEPMCIVLHACAATLTAPGCGLAPLATSWKISDQMS